MYTNADAKNSAIVALYNSSRESMHIWADSQLDSVFVTKIVIFGFFPISVRRSIS